jgi:predicted molibdopterin-dependent oxidoreductase YjgC
MKADTSPNTRGAQALGLSFDGRALIERAARRELSALHVFGHDVVDIHSEATILAAMANLDLVVFQGSNANRTGEVAHVILPSAVYAEKDGTFTNCQGRVQRIHPAFPPLGEARSDWQILLELARRVNVSLDFNDARTIFADMAAREPAFHGLTYEIIGDQGALLNGSNVT